MPVVMERVRAQGRHMRIGLINNMPDEALEATERQFISILDAASGQMPVHLSLYTLPGVPRSDESARRIADAYSSMEGLWQSRLDGIILTGREPVAEDLTEEPYWESLTKTVDWAQANAYSAIWSCLAAHAATLYLDGIHRIKNAEKLFGVFECARSTKHPLTAGPASHFLFPHSRWNGVSEIELTGCGYQVLTKAGNGEVDTFIKSTNSLFVFFQGHPEYDSNTLLREYRRDVVRYFKGDTKRYPLTPVNYFDEATAEALNALRTRTLFGDCENLPHAINEVLQEGSIRNDWRASATRIYANWLSYIRDQIAPARRPTPLMPVNAVGRRNENLSVAEHF